jgi:hypothetical protein
MTIAPQGITGRHYGRRMTEPSAATPPQRPAPSRPPRPAAPQRPALSVPVPSPLEGLIGPMPRALSRSLGLWVASWIVGAVVTGYVIAKRDELLLEIETAVRTDQPTITAESLDRVVNVSLYAALGGVLLIMVVEAVLALVMRRRHNWARLLLALVGLLSLPAFFVAQELLAVDVPLRSNYVQLGFAVQGLLVLVAVVTMFAPSANAWFRLHHRGRR